MYSIPPFNMQIEIDNHCHNSPFSYSQERTSDNPLVIKERGGVTGADQRSCKDLPQTLWLGSLFHLVILLSSIFAQSILHVAS